MPNCPRCTFPLKPITGHGGRTVVEHHHCPRCRGVFHCPQGEVKPYEWLNFPTTRYLGPSPIQCPLDKNRFETYSLALAEQEVQLDICPRCMGIWFDVGERRRLKKILSATRVAQEAAENSEGNALTYLFQLLTRLPIEVYNPVRKRPVAVITFISILVAVFAAQLSLGNPFTRWLWLDARQLWSGLRIYLLITHALLHGGY
jgi:Zn-finger nucleic acid-binding protein